MASAAPKVVVLAGPNGAGKSTSAERLLKGALSVDEFVNADTIAQGLSAFAQQRVAVQAGRIMVARLAELEAAGTSFGFETTLASRSHARRLARLRDSGFTVHLIFLWLVSADEAVARVAERVRAGGHDVPEQTVRRRYEAGIKNLFDVYAPLADTWQIIDNSLSDAPYSVAVGDMHGATRIFDTATWQTIQAQIHRP